MYLFHDPVMSQIVPPVQLPVSFPQIKSWELNTPAQVLHVVDLTGATDLSLSCKGFRDKLVPTLLPSQLTTLRLTDLLFESETLSPNVPHLMPHLVGLMIVDSIMQGRLQDYFDCPKLTSLFLEHVGFYSIETDEKGEPINIIDVPFSESVSFSSLPELENLYLRSMGLDEKLPAALQPCLHLEQIHTQFCFIGNFLPSFAAAMADSKKLPALKSLHLECPLRVKEPWSLEKFTRECVNHRPGLTISVEDAVSGGAS
jgi:hypothetical protein